MIIRLTGATATKHLGGLNFYSITVDNKSGGVTVTLDKTTVDKASASSTTVTGTLTVAEGYTLSSVKIMMGNTDKTSAWYNSSTGAITISGITADVVITANATSNSGSGDSGSGDSGSDVVLNLNDYATYIGCIAGSTNTMQYTGKGSTASGNMFYQIPIADFTNPDSVTVVAGTSTKAYVSFFKEKVATAEQVPPYATGHTTQTILNAGTSQTFTIPTDAVYMYVLATNGTGSSLRPASVTFHNAIYKGSSDPASGSGGGEISGTAFGTTWAFGQVVSSGGSLTEEPTYAATTNTITRESGKNLKYTPYTSDEHGLWLLVATYKSDDTFIERKAFDPATTTAETTITLGDDVTKVRLAYGRSSSTKVNMDQTSLNYLNLAWV